MEQISISDIQRNLHKLQEFDIVEIVDKKRNTVKGYFVDSKYAAEILELLELQKRSKTIIQDLAGSLREYANPEITDKESEAWKDHVKEKYQR